jgi:hypothetical protein
MTAEWNGKKITDLDNNYLINIRNWIKKKNYVFTRIVGGGDINDPDSMYYGEEDDCQLDVYAEVCNEIFARLKDGRLAFEDLRGRL